jgi:hypothetical protein
MITALGEAKSKAKARRRLTENLSALGLAIWDDPFPRGLRTRLTGARSASE